MSPLAKNHPMQLLLGAVIVGEEIATKGRQTTFAILCRDALEWATETRDLLKEIACDAAVLGENIQSVAKDGLITAEERELLVRGAREIEAEALTGKIQ